MKKLGVIALISATLFLGAFSIKSLGKDQNVDDVLKTTMNKYNVQGYIIGEEPATIDVDLYEEEDIEKVEKYIKSNLSDEDLNHYDIKVFAKWTVKD